ncbi:antibiotic biosynthesis monooxygenase family protein [Amphritea balenae]|uniref:Antibiotic biosynthesis monooxygenase n=1 Tax=Amphritea balenae TaxID=452629 RepID=A0A3P1SU33_9GAMM|nr:antibiotic biosynthesis monooxygenase [Amphritea balenae]RRD00600.1 antibiotic biosynthesis monooxygenase [Amphritea balenae]GGK69431.1 antibiotic biosynthesis monooxygenase [Amphritea balenae]
MYIAMNRFKIKPGHEQEFIEIWKNRDSHLNEVAGFISFNLLQGEPGEEYTLMSSHAVWQDRASFDGWLTSDAFKKAHASAGGKNRKDIYIGPPSFEGFEAVL